MERSKRNKLMFNISAWLLMVIAGFTIVLLLTGRQAFSFLFQKWDGVSVANNFAGGTGTSVDPYIISNPYELAYLSEVINDKKEDTTNGGFFYTKSYKLIRDIDLGGYSWTPIGSDGTDTSFKGSLDGDNHTIYDLRLDSSSISDQVDYNHLGLFGKIDSGFIKNLSLDTVNVDFDNINTQGISVGTLIGTTAGESTNKFNNITVSNIKYTGTGTFNNESFLGELVGRNKGVSTFNNIILNGTSLLNIENVTSGLLSGDNENTSYTNTLIISTGDILFGKINENISNLSGRVYSIGSKNYNWVLTDGKYAKFEVLDSTSDILNYLNENISNDDYYFDLDESSNPILSNGDNISTLSMIEGTEETNGFIGNGTVDFPYLIITESDLNFLREQVNNGNTYNDSYFQIAADINLTEKFIPIGDINNSFKGNLDGAGHTISGFDMDITSNNTSISSYGLFGSVGGGSSQTIKNIEFDSPRMTFDFDYDNSNVNGAHVGYVSGTVYRNVHISGILINDGQMDNTTSFNIDSRNFHLKVGGIAGFITNTSTNNSDPGSSLRYSIDDCYVDNDMLFSSISTSSLANGLNTSFGGIVGSIYDQPVYPDNCLVTGTIDPKGGFIGPIFGQIIDGTSTSASGMDNYWQGNNTTTSLTINSYYTNMQINGKVFTSSWTRGDNTSNSTTYRVNRITSNVAYLQGINKAINLLYSGYSYQQIVNSWNDNNDDVDYVYDGGVGVTFKERVSASITEPLDYYYQVDLNDNYNTGDYTYSWYEDGVLQNDFTSTSYSIEANDFTQLLVDRNVSSIVYDGTYYGANSFTIPKLSLDVKLYKNASNTGFYSALEGDVLDYVDLSTFTYQWYSEDITGLETKKIDGATGTSINNVSNSLDYKLVVNNSTYPVLTVDASISIVDRNVIYVDYLNGNNNNDGYTEDTAVETMEEAYSKLSSDGTTDSNIIVLMGDYEKSNEYLYGPVYYKTDTFKKAATVTGLYKGKDYDSSMLFYGSSPNNTNNDGRYLFADTVFMYFDLDGRRTTTDSTSSGITYFYLQGYNFTMGKGMNMINYQNHSNTNGLLSPASPNFHLLGGFNNYNVVGIPDVQNGNSITLLSGTYARIMLAGRNSTLNSVSHNMFASKDKPYTRSLVVDLQSSTTRYTYDIGLITGGQTDGSMYANINIDIKNAKIGRVLGGSIGYNGSGRTSSVYPQNTFIGSTTLNISGGTIQELYGNCLGRTNDGITDNTYFYGTSTINMSGGTVNTQVYTAGAGAVSGYDANSSDPLKSYGKDYPTTVNFNMSGGTINGNLYGAGYGFSNYVATNLAPSDSGNLYGNSNINITGGTINGNVFGAGRGYQNSYQRNIAQVIGESTITYTGGTITGTIYGAGEGVTSSGYSEVAKVIGKSTLNVSKDFNQNVYGGGKSSKVEGETFVNLNGDFNSNVYGGGEQGDVLGTSSVTLLDGNVPYIYGAGKNGASTNTLVTIQDGVVPIVFGGGQSSDVTDTSAVTLNGGSVTELYGSGAQGNSSKTNILLKGGSAETVYGGGNNSNVSDSTYVLLNGSNVKDIFGGSNVLGSTKTKVEINSGDVTTVYGGNNAGGSAISTDVIINNGDIPTVYAGGNVAPSIDTKVTLNSASVDSLYGGGSKAEVSNSNVFIKDGSATNVFGGGKEGITNISNIQIDDGLITTLYGGGDLASTDITNVTTNGGTITTLFGGGNKGSVTTSNVLVNDGSITTLYGGGNDAGVTTTNSNVYGGNVTNVFGGSNHTGDVTTSNVNIGNASNSFIDVDTSFTANDTHDWETTEYDTVADVTVTVKNKSDQTIDDWAINLSIPNSVVHSNYSNSIINTITGGYSIDGTNRYWGYNSLSPGDTYTFTFSVFTKVLKENFVVGSSVVRPGGSSSLVTTGNVYGGNNAGGVTTNSNIKVFNANINNIFGGGNAADVSSSNVEIKESTIGNVYGGGNVASIRNNTYVDIDDSSITTNVYGGGNEGVVSGSTYVYVTNTNARGSLYAGGNGSTAIVAGNTSIYVDGDTIVGYDGGAVPETGCIFGSGNAAATGITSGSKSTVNLVGGEVYGNVYGGANTSVVYGKAYTNIGMNATDDNTLNEANIYVHGTVFGGGEANASGSDKYDYAFISVTEGIDVNINGNGYADNGHDFLLTGSIFGSGNASSSSGSSTITIKDLGSKALPSTNVSIQRANKVILDNSVVQLEGTTDRTNEYSTIKYSFNRIDSLTVKNNTVLLLKQNANLLKEFNSMVDVNGAEVKADVSIDKDNKTVTKNVDNRVYLIPNRNLNITTNEAATSYGKVNGMTFFGMYNSYSAGSYSYGVYDRSVNYGDTGNASMALIGGSYVLGLHSLNHDIEKDGFYSNYLTDDYSEVYTDYINPTPPDASHYMWTIGMQAINYSLTLNASKYSSLGTYELSMLDFPAGDTTFNVLGFNSEGLGNGVSLVDSNVVPKVTNTSAEANKVLGLSMKTETREWTSYGVTKLLSEGTGAYTGTNTYKTDSQKLAPSLMFYLYHAKNISLNGDLGTVVVTMQALVPKNEIEYNVQLITITIDITARNYDDGDAYDASITYDKKYEMPSATNVNITNQSQFTAYYSLFAEAENFSSFYGKNNEYYHALVTDYVLPSGTQITMMDYGVSEDTPEYYYLTITDSIYNSKVAQLACDGEVTYRLSDFVKMGSTSATNTYSDQIANRKYYSDEYNRTIEEFIFIFDFKNTNTTGDHLNKSMLFELRNSDDRSDVAVLGIRQNLMHFSLYDSSNMVLQENVTPESDYSYYGITSKIDYVTNVAYDQTDNREAIINTNFESSSMGLNIYLYDSSGTQISSSLLSGTSFRMDNVNYFADSDGVIRIKLSGKVSNLNKTIYLTSATNLPAGQYTIKYVLFASDDGLHNNDLANSAVKTFDLNVVGDDNALVVSVSDKDKIVDGDTLLTEESDSVVKYTTTLHSVLNKPNIRLSVYKRKTDDVNSIDYEEVDFYSVFAFAVPFANMMGYKSDYNNEMLLTTRTDASANYEFELMDGAKSGTYKIAFRLYDNNQLIEEDDKYLIITKATS